jgi:ribosomal protein S14
VLLASHEDRLLEMLCDEVKVAGGRLLARRATRAGRCGNINALYRKIGLGRNDLAASRAVIPQGADGPR